MDAAAGLKPGEQSSIHNPGTNNKNYDSTDDNQM